ncbi:hypothetical protein Pelo_16755 [Pelomyxa schiedti]|nr:hypothetical protein Pelo_16755 [Pelomyxa schiedti]
MGQEASSGVLDTVSLADTRPERRAEKYLQLQQRFLLLAGKSKHPLVRAAAVSGHARKVARLAAAVAPGHELDKCSHVRWDDLKPLAPLPPSFSREAALCAAEVFFPALCPPPSTRPHYHYYTHWYSVVHVCAVLGHADEMDAVLEAWVPRGAISGFTAGPKGVAVAAADYLVNHGAGPESRTPLMLAVINGNAEVVRRLVGRWGAAGVGGADLMRPMLSHGRLCNPLYLAVGCGVVDCVDAILSAVDEAVRVKLVGMEASNNRTLLEEALSKPDRPGNCGLIKVLANPKWGGWMGAEEILTHLCGVFCRGLAIAYFSGPKQCRPVIGSHPKFVQSIDEISPKTGDTVLYKATIKGDTEVALEALSFGADPNIQCKRNPKWCDFPEELRTPMVMVIASEQKELVKEMARRGGVLPLAFCNRMSDSAFSLEAYVDGTWDQHIAANKEFRKSLPAVKWNSELRGSSPFDLPFIPSQIEFTPGARVQIDVSLTQMMVQFNTEITGVMELLDIQSLGRVQQTSRFWYFLSLAKVSSLHPFFFCVQVSMRQNKCSLEKSTCKFKPRMEPNSEGQGGEMP